MAMTESVEWNISSPDKGPVLLVCMVFGRGCLVIKEMSRNNTKRKSHHVSIDVLDIIKGHMMSDEGGTSRK